MNRQDHSKPVVLGSTEGGGIHGCERDRCWVVIPAYNEAATVREVALRSRQECAQVIVVDDGSTDNTAECLAGLDVIVLRNEDNAGKAESLARIPAGVGSWSSRYHYARCGWAAQAGRDFPVRCGSAGQS